MQLIVSHWPWTSHVINVSWLESNMVVQQILLYALLYIYKGLRDDVGAGLQSVHEQVLLPSCCPCPLGCEAGWVTGRGSKGQGGVGVQGAVMI